MGTFKKMRAFERFMNSRQKRMRLNDAQVPEVPEVPQVCKEEVPKTKIEESTPSKPKMYRLRYKSLNLIDLLPQVFETNQLSVGEVPDFPSHLLSPKSETRFVWDGLSFAIQMSHLVVWMFQQQGKQEDGFTDMFYELNPYNPYQERNSKCLPFHARVWHTKEGPRTALLELLKILRSKLLE